MKDDRTRLRHMLEAAREAVQFCENRTRVDLETDRMLSLAVVRLLEIIGDAANGVSRGFQDDHAAIPWRGIGGMRNRLVHGYFDVDLDIVWETVRNDLPALISKLEPLLRKAD